MGRIRNERKCCYMKYYLQAKLMQITVEHATQFMFPAYCTYAYKVFVFPNTMDGPASFHCCLPRSSASICACTPEPACRQVYMDNLGTI